MTHLQATGQHKNKAGLTHAPVYYPFAATLMANTQLSRVQNVHTKYRKYCCWFLNLCLLNLVRKLMHHIYYHVYSTSPFVWHRDATFQEISDRIKNFRKYETVSLHKNNWSIRGGKVWKKRKMCQISLFKTKMAIYFTRKCSVRYFSAVIISKLMWRL